MSQYVYREKTLQLAATVWMRKHWGYVELASDEEATGDRMDSIGLFSGRIIAIEVKPVVHNGLVRHRQGRSGSLEAKIAATLRGVYLGHQGHQLDVIRANWDGRTPISVGILCGACTAPGLQELSVMLHQRAGDWCFGFRVLRWTGTEVVVLAEEPPPFVRLPEQIDVPELIGHQKRAALPSMRDLQRLADEKEVGPVFAHLVERCLASGLQPTRLRSGVSFKLPRQAGGSAIIAAYIDRSDKVCGLNVGIDDGALQVAPETLPGGPAPRAGFLNTNRHILSPDQLDGLLGKIEALIALRVVAKT